MAGPVSVIELAVREAKADRAALITRVVADLKASGGLGFTADTTTAEEVAYYKQQIFDPVTGQLNIPAIVALCGTAGNDFKDGRIGPKGLQRVVALFAADFARQLKGA